MYTSSEEFTTFSTREDLESSELAFGPEASTFDASLHFQDDAGSLTELKRKYSAMLIQLDRLRSQLQRADVELRVEGEWSVKEIVGHLIDSDREIWWPRIQALLTQENPSFSEVDEHALIRKNNWQSLPLNDILAQLMRIRWANAVRLNELPDSSFSREGAHPSLGTLSLSTILHILVAHDSYYLHKIRTLAESSSYQHELTF